VLPPADTREEMWAGLLSENSKIGLVLLGVGVFFMMLGVVLFLDSGLMSIGNLIILSSFPFFFGLVPTLHFLNPVEPLLAPSGERHGWREKTVGRVALLLGVLLVLFRWALVGLVLELVGFAVLFSGFIAKWLAMARDTPAMAQLDMPFLRPLVDYLAPPHRPPV
jgi:hypothetical protein